MVDNRRRQILVTFIDPIDPGSHLTRRLTERIIEYVREHRAETADLTSIPLDGLAAALGCKVIEEA
ncbi:MAG: hypothetical protein WBD75_00560 [Phycisphaerae bacterium]